jgi:hypothetical protein
MEKRSDGPIWINGFSDWWIAGKAGMGDGGAECGVPSSECKRTIKMQLMRYLALFSLSLMLTGCATQRSEQVSDGAVDFQRLERRLKALRIKWRVPGMSVTVARDGTNL